MTSSTSRLTAWTPGAVRSWLCARQSLRAEAVALLALYGANQIARGLVASDAGEECVRSSATSKEG